jgi:membrane protein
VATEAKIIRAVLFDIDGTLIDSNDLHVRAWQDAFAEDGVDIAPDRIAGQIGKGGDHLVPALAPELGDQTQARIAKREGDIFQQGYIAQALPFPHARDLLARVHDSGARIVFASSAAQEQLDHYIDLMAVRDLIEATTSIDDVQSSKPAPDIFEIARKKLAGLHPDQVLAVGDTPYDIESAGKSGIGTVAVLSGGFDREALTGAVAIYIDVADLLARFDASPLAR